MVAFNVPTVLTDFLIKHLGHKTLQKDQRFFVLDICILHVMLYALHFKLFVFLLCLEFVFLLPWLGLP